MFSVDALKFLNMNLVKVVSALSLVSKLSLDSELIVSQTALEA
jgi:hypothetical protein